MFAELMSRMGIHVLWLYALLSLLGLVCHVLKQSIELKTGTRDYFANNKASSWLALICTVVGTLAAMYAGETSILAYFAVGFMSNSVLKNLSLPSFGVAK